MDKTSPQTSKQKLDAVLGIAPDKSIDDFLESLTIENDSAKDAMDKIDDGVKSEVASIDDAMKSLTLVGNSDETGKLMSLVGIEKSLKHIDELIAISKEVIKHIYENIACTELVDSELVHAAAAFIESCHLNVKEYIDLYKDRLKFFDKVQFEMIQQKHKKELIELKHKLDLEKIDAKNPTIDVTPEGNVPFDTDGIINFLHKQESKDK